MSLSKKIKLLSGAFPSLCLVLILVLNACSTGRKAKKSGSLSGFIDTTALIQNVSHPIYRATPEIKNSILHTELHLSFDYNTSSVKGQALLTIKPYFYPQDSLIIDAVGFSISEINIQNKSLVKTPQYDYNGKQIKIKLPATYTRLDTFKLALKYSAFPDKNETAGSEAILSDKGLYFINPNRKIHNLPRQIWSQGETQSNSRWFPTIESNGQKMTQDIYLTVDAGDKTLSNGLLIEQTNHDNGKRTDHWRQKLPSSPYLTMIAVGNFSVVKDTWKGKEVSYYVEPGYEKYARDIFGKTPQMIGYFSDLLKYPYVWEKYSQIAVRGYISGAMENTTATIHGQDIQRTDAELLDEDGEDIIAHELFHHWFGDLVTCESWTHLPLNESFATYSEYLWLNHSRGEDAGNWQLLNDLRVYLDESQYKKVSMIRFYYENREDMFDSHSYNKGGLILHFLRSQVGDDAFFEALHQYLQNNSFKTAEIEDLRLVFERVTGRDLSWFFEEWFRYPGHPELKINQRYNDTTHKVIVNISQMQNLSFAPLYHLPVQICVYHNKNTKTYSVQLNDESASFEFDCPGRPDLVVVDPNRYIPCVRFENKSDNEWIFQYKNAHTLFDRVQAIEYLAPLKTSESFHFLLDAVNDPFPKVRERVVNLLADHYARKERSELSTLFKSLCKKDESSLVRGAAMAGLEKVGPKDAEMNEFYIACLKDPSFLVKSTALANLYSNDPDLGFEYARKFKNDSNYFMVNRLSSIFASSGSEEENNYYLDKAPVIYNQDKYEFIESYGTYLLGRSNETINKGIELLEREARENNIWFIRLHALNKLNDLRQMYDGREKEYAGNPNKKNELEMARQQKEKIAALIDHLRLSVRDNTPEQNQNKN